MKERDEEKGLEKKDTILQKDILKESAITLANTIRFLVKLIIRIFKIIFFDRQPIWYIIGFLILTLIVTIYNLLPVDFLIGPLDNISLIFVYIWAISHLTDEVEKENKAQKSIINEKKDRKTKIIKMITAIENHDVDFGPEISDGINALREEGYDQQNKLPPQT